MALAITILYHYGECRNVQCRVLMIVMLVAIMLSVVFY
jgi:hypothetical protein